jgi:hypothetical protein
MVANQTSHYPMRCLRSFWSVLCNLCLQLSPASLHRVLIPSTIGEIGGYGARIGAHYNNTNWGSFIVQGVLILVGPLFFAATIYMMLGRTIRLAGGEDVSIVKPKWCTRLFLAADISTLIIQGLGGFLYVKRIGVEKMM